MTNSTKLTGLWKKQDKSGKDYFTGSLTGTARLVIFPNGYKSKDTDPDYIAYVVPNERREERRTDSTDSNEAHNEFGDASESRAQQKPSVTPRVAKRA